MYSSDLEELVGMCDVIFTMFRGQLIAKYSGESIAIERILADITHAVKFESGPPETVR